MPKAKFFERRPSSAKGCWLAAGICLWTSVLHAQTPSLQDMVDSAKQAKQQEHSKALSDAYKPVPAALPAAPKTGAAPPPAPLAAVAPALPVLRAIYGVNQLIEAEVVFDGQSYSLYSDEARVDIGPWTYGVVFHEGVLLVQKPLNAIQSGLLDSWSDQGLERLISCQRLGLTRNNCLFLPASKASSGAVAASRTAPAPAAGVLPPLPR